MSYILEALNKSEQERRTSQTPDLGTVHRPPPTGQKSSRTLFWVVGLFAAINGFGILYWVNSESADNVVENNVENVAPVTATTDSQIQNRSIQNRNIQNQTVQKPVVQEARDTSTLPNTPELITPNSINASANVSPKNQVVRITELPVNVQRRVPNLVFSSHLYSDEPEFRMVNINNRMIKEGDVVSNDIRLVEITEQGVVLSYLHYVFEVSVLRDWSFN